MDAARLTPIGMINLVMSSPYRPMGVTSPPAQFPADAVKLDVNLRADPRYGLYPLNSGVWTSQLALRFVRPPEIFERSLEHDDDIEPAWDADDDFDSAYDDPFEQNRDEAFWFAWLDSQRIGVAYYGKYEFSVQESDELHHGLLMEMLRGESLALASNTTDFRPGSDDAKKIQSWWNDRSRRDLQRIKGALLAGGLLPTDLQLLMNDEGRVVVIDPELFTFSSDAMSGNAWLTGHWREIEAPLSGLVDTGKSSG